MLPSSRMDVSSIVAAVCALSGTSCTVASDGARDDPTESPIGSVAIDPEGADEQRLSPPDARASGMRHEVLVNEGELCMAPRASWQAEPMLPEEVPLHIGDALVFRVAAPSCMSASCDVNRSARCEVTPDGRRLFVDSELSYDHVDGPHCTLDCGMLAARCPSPSLEAGTHEVIFAGERLHIEVPSRIETCRAMGPQRAETPHDGG